MEKSKLVKLFSALILSGKVKLVDVFFIRYRRWLHVEHSVAKPDSWISVLHRGFLRKIYGERY